MLQQVLGDRRQADALANSSVFIDLASTHKAKRTRRISEKLSDSSAPLDTLKKALKND